MTISCPKCKGSMEAIDYNGIEIDRCEKCRGLWFDHLELQDLKTLAGAEAIDIGDEFVGAKFDKIRDIDCPKCDLAMRHVVSHEPFEIKFESCAKCHGTFFDAGEFRDYMEDEIYDEFKQVLEGLD